MRRLHAARALATASAHYLRIRARKGLLDGATVRRAWPPLLSRLQAPLPRDAPLIATIAVTERCTLHCGHCSAHAEPGRSEPRSSAALIASIESLVRSGCPVIALTGGEPLLRAELPRLLERIPSNVVSLLYTSGVGLNDAVARVLGAGPHRVVSFSVDHHDAEEHDRRRGYRGAHAAAMAGIDRLAGGVGEVHVASLVTRDRLDRTRLTAFARDLRRRGVSCLQLFVPKPVGRQRNVPAALLSVDEEQQLGRLAAELNQDADAPLVVAYPTIERSEALGCCAGYARVHIDARGNVCPCDFAPIAFGNLDDETFATIWQRMRERFAAPGRSCLASLDEMPAPSTLDPRPPEVFGRWGEGAYRTLLHSLTLASTMLEPDIRG